jgi:hypothetical protein
MTNLVWHQIEWVDDSDGFSYPKEPFPVDTLLICKFKDSAGIHFSEMVYADTFEGFHALQEAISKSWDIHNERWDIETEWEDDYFPIAYALHPDLAESP